MSTTTTLEAEPSTYAGPNALRDRWQIGTVNLGAYCSIGNTFSVEIMARAGFDYIAIDQQHGLTGPDALIPMIQTLGITNTPAIVRVPGNEPSAIMRALDMGAQGVIIPLVNTAEDAKLAVMASKYPPIGDRSWGALRSFLADYGFNPEIGNRRTLLIPQIESKTAIENIDEILSVEGVDGIYIGPNDLALTNGWAPTAKPQEHRDQVLRALDAAHRHGKPAGMGCGGIEGALEWAREGFEMLMVNSDWNILKAAAKSHVDGVRKGLAS